MVRIPPWRWSLRGPLSPDNGPPLPIPDTLIRPIADRLGKQRPWLSQDENWFAAERALRQKPWRPWVIRFSGEKERSGWDWADLLLKVSVPVLILGLSTAYSIISADRQEKIARADKERQEVIARELKEESVVTNYIKDMQPLFVDKGLRSSPLDSEVRAVARGLTLTALSQVEDSGRKQLIIRFLLDSGMNAIPGNLIDLSQASLQRAYLADVNLSKANLSKADLREAYLYQADLEGVDFRKAALGGAFLFEAILKEADLSDALLSHANLMSSDLRGATLDNADLSGAILFSAKLHGADLKNVQWDEKTKWPSSGYFYGAKNIPKDLKKHLGL